MLRRHWSRELQALGHTVRLMPPAYVKPYVKRQKGRNPADQLHRLPEC
jgi:transposase